MMKLGAKQQDQPVPTRGKVKSRRKGKSENPKTTTKKRRRLDDSSFASRTFKRRRLASSTAAAPPVSEPPGAGVDFEGAERAPQPPDPEPAVGAQGKWMQLVTVMQLDHELRWSG